MLNSVRLLIAWGTVGVFALAPALLSDLSNPFYALLLFAWLLGVIFWSAFGVVHEAEELADMLGEPYGTLILTLAIVLIEVALISAVMLGTQAPTLGRDTMFAVLMIVLNGVVGIGLLLGGLRHGQQTYNIQGASSYLAVIIPLTIIALVLPNFTTSSMTGTLSTWQAIFFSLFTLMLYTLFLKLQVGRHQSFFIDPRPKEKAMSNLATSPVVVESVKINQRNVILRHTFLLLAHILPIVLLSKSLAKLLDHGIETLGAPAALGGVLIAGIVFTPEAIAALRAVTSNQLQRALNLCLGAATSTLGLTVPAVLLIGIVTGQDVILGLSNAEMTLLAMTLFLCTLTFSGLRTTMLEGGVHLIVFFVYVVLIFSP